MVRETAAGLTWWVRRCMAITALEETRHMNEQGKLGGEEERSSSRRMQAKRGVQPSVSGGGSQGGSELTRT